MTSAERDAAARIMRIRNRRARQLSQARARRDAENRSFSNRMRYDQHAVWNQARYPERSLIPSTFPAFAAACRKWGVPAGYRMCQDFHTGNPYARSPVARCA